MRVLLLFACCFFYYPLNAQKTGQNKIDSLLLEVPKTSKDTTKVNLLTEISFAYAFLDSQEGIKYGNEALALAKKINFTKGVAASNLATGINNNFHGNYDVSLEHLNYALVGYENIKNKAGIAKTLLNIGSNYQFRADFPKALEYNLKALKINEETNNKKEAQKALNNIGNVYFAQSDFTKALDFYTKALEINKEIGYKKGMSSAYGNIGLVYEEQKNYKKSIEFNLKSLEIDEEIGNNIGIAINVTNLSGAYNKMNNYEKALEQVYTSYKSRADIEILFDTFKNTLHADRSYMRSNEMLEAWLFINHLALIFYYRLYKRLIQYDMLKKYSPKGILTHLRTIKKVKINDN